MQEGHRGARRLRPHLPPAASSSRGRVPQISIVTGVSAGGGAYSPALTDFVVMTERAGMFLTGPRRGRARRSARSRRWRSSAGRAVHERNGVCQFVAGRRRRCRRARARAARLPAPARRRAAAARARPCAPPEPTRGRRSRAQPAQGLRRPRRRRARSSTAASMLEVSPRWARNMVTALGRIDGRPVGVVANQPRRLGGVIDAAASREGGALRRTLRRASGCRSSSSSTPPGSCRAAGRRRDGVIRHGATLLRAFAGATVPQADRRPAQGLRRRLDHDELASDLGADTVFAWPGAEIGIMAAGQAVDIVHRRRLAEARRPGARRPARRRIRGGAPERRGRGGERLRRRGDRALADREVLAWSLEMLTGAA